MTVMEYNTMQDALVELLIEVWRRWKKENVGKKWTDVFSHRIKTASSKPTFGGFLDKLCYGLGVQSVDLNQGLIDYLQNNAEQALKEVRESTVLLVALVSVRTGVETKK